MHFIAEDSGNESLGFIHANKLTSYYARIRYAVSFRAVYFRFKRGKFYFAQEKATSTKSSFPFGKR